MGVLQMKYIKRSLKWQLKEKCSNDLVEQLLINRKISKNDWDNFINPNFSASYDPFLLKDMKKALVRLEKAILRKEKIGIFADYDADGIPAAALLKNTLNNKFGLETIVYIPSRKEGYGLNIQGIDYLKKQNVNLIITVDLGIREHKNIEYIKTLGLDTIITDHHEPSETLPKALAIINPKRKDSKYPFRELSGGGVVFKLIQALQKRLGQITDSELKWMLDLVAITTICDVVPLVDENRIFAKFGLIVLKKTKRVGLSALYEVAKIDREKINTYSVGFQIGPRLNAPGRLAQGNDSFNLLSSEDTLEAKRLAEELNEINIKRQAELDRMLFEARNKIFAGNLDRKKVIILWDKSWQSGLIGLVAGRITEEFSRPCLIFEEGAIKSKGSGRSIDGYNLVEALELSKSMLISFGGHAKAAGLTVENKFLEHLYSNLNKIADSKLKDEDLVPKILIDAKLLPKEINLAMFDQVKKLEPFGLGNPRPVFMMEKVIASDLRKIGAENKHIKFKIENLDVVGFNMSENYQRLNEKKPFDIVFSLDEDNWGGMRKIQLKVIDIKF